MKYKQSNGVTLNISNECLNPSLRFSLAANETFPTLFMRVCSVFACDENPFAINKIVIRNQNRVVKKVSAIWFLFQNSISNNSLVLTIAKV